MTKSDQFSKLSSVLVISEKIFANFGNSINIVNRATFIQLYFIFRLFARFSEINELDEGEYICTAENVAGSVSAIAVLEIISPPVISLNPSGPLTVVVGQPLKVECFARGKPTPSVSWLDHRVSYGYVSMYYAVYAVIDK